MYQTMQKAATCGVDNQYSQAVVHLCIPCTFRVAQQLSGSQTRASSERGQIHALAALTIIMTQHQVYHHTAQKLLHIHSSNKFCSLF